VVKLYVEYSSECVDIIEDTLGEDGQWSGYREDIYESEVTGVYTDPDDLSSCWWESFDCDGGDIPKKVYVVYVHYSTGDTFSNSHGHLAITGVFRKSSEADKMIDDIVTKKYKGYAPWLGYFDRLESVSRRVFTVL
jgi:hypothetical protein